ncbi:MAG: tetratricopeptide repeat protein, partial [Myxococcota bacterium]
MTQPPAERTDAPELAPSREAAEVRIASLRAEVEATEDRARQAVLHYEIGHLCEQQLRNDAMAVKEYLTAYNLDASFRPPLFDLARIFERRLSFKNLARLYEAEQRSAAHATDAASALVDRGVLLEDHEGKPAEARRLYEQALDTDASHRGAALMLERTVRAQGDADAAARVVAARARQARNPVLAGCLLVESALHLEQQGDIDGAIDALERAVAQPAARWRFLEQLERLARRQQRIGELIAAVEGRAALAEAVAAGEATEHDSGAFAVAHVRDADH